MKFPILTNVFLAIASTALASPVAEPEPESQPVSKAVDTSPLLEKRDGKSCKLVKLAPGVSGIPCYTGPNTGYSIVTHFALGTWHDVYCKAYGGVFEGDSYVILPGRKLLYQLD
jgi:hypothetical protein